MVLKSNLFHFHITNSQQDTTLTRTQFWSEHSQNSNSSLVKIVENLWKMKMSLFYICKLYKTEVLPQILFFQTPLNRVNKWNTTSKLIKNMYVIFFRYAKFAVKYFLGSNLATTHAIRPPETRKRGAELLFKSSLGRHPDWESIFICTHPNSSS
jgi:hypothetical protein